MWSLGDTYEDGLKWEMLYIKCLYTINFIFFN